MNYLKTHLSAFLIACFLVLVNLVPALSQAPDFAWANSGSGAGGDHGYSIAVDAVGNSYVTGTFFGTATFGTTTLISNGDNDIFIIKYDPLGNVVWAQKAGGTGGDFGRRIAIDSNGNSYITGYFYSNSITFGSTTLINNGYSDMFIAKYDAAGNPLWARNGGGIGQDKGEGIAVDSNGNSYITGTFIFTAIFGTTTLVSTNSTYDIFVAKYDAAGTLQWANKAGGTNSDSGFGISTDNAGNCYVSGHFSGTGIFGTTTITSNGLVDVFIAKYDAMGNVLWARNGGGSGEDFSFDVKTDASGNCYATGWISGNATFGTIALTGNGGNDIFLVKYDPMGNLIWARNDGGIYYDVGTSIAIDGSGSIYLTGWFGGSITFGSTTLNYSGVNDIFVVKYDASGNAQWAKQAGGTLHDTGRSIGVDGSGNCYVTGEFNGTATFDALSVSSSGGNDMFIAKLAPPLPTLITNQVATTSVCQGATLTVPFTASGVFNSGNVFSAQLSDAAGSFAAPIVIGSLTGTVSGTITATLPTSIAPGTGYRIRVVASNPGVSGVDNGVNITIAGAPAVSASGITTICAGQMLQLSASGAATYSWTGPDNFTSSLQGFQIANAGVAAAGTYSVFGSSGGCMGAAAVVVTVNPVPVVVVTSAQTICEGSSATLVASGADSYIWQPGNISGSMISVSPAATTTYSVVGTTSGCSAPAAAVAVSVLPSPSAVISPGGLMSFCAGAIGTLTAGTVSGATYQWLQDGQPVSGAAGTTFTPSVAGDYQLIVTAANGCSDTSGITTIMVHPQAIALLSQSGPIRICTGWTANLSAGTSVGNSFQWLHNGQPVTGANTGVLATSDPGYYQVVVSFGGSCPDTSATIEVQVEQMVTPLITSADPLSFCAGGSATLVVTGHPFGQFQWFKDGVWYAITQTNSLTVTEPGAYQVTPTVYPNCTYQSNTVFVSVLPVPEATVTPAGLLSLCSGESLTLSAAPVTGASYQWLLNGQPLAGASAAVLTLSAVGTYQLVVTAGPSCSDTSAAIITTEQALPVLTVLQDRGIRCTDEVVLSAEGAAAYSWSTGASGAAIAVPSTFSATYTVTGTGLNGCRASTEAAVAGVPCEVVTPNIITPNGDGVNDMLQFSHTPQGFDLRIFSRWGKPVFERAAYHLRQDWQAQGLPDGLYFYHLKAADGQEWNGWVEVAR